MSVTQMIKKKKNNKSTHFHPLLLWNMKELRTNFNFTSVTKNVLFQFLFSQKQKH